jgi:hypothetical protein
MDFPAQPVALQETKPPVKKVWYVVFPAVAHVSFAVGIFGLARWLAPTYASAGAIGVITEQTGVSKDWPKSAWMTITIASFVLCLLCVVATFLHYRAYRTIFDTWRKTLPTSQQRLVRRLEFSEAMPETWFARLM